MDFSFPTTFLPPVRQISKRALRTILGYERAISEIDHALLIQLRKGSELDPPFLQDLQTTLLEQPGCLFAGYVSELDRLVVFTDSTRCLDKSTVLALVCRVEQAHGWAGRRFRKETLYPGDNGRKQRLLLEMALDIGGFAGGLLLSRVSNRTFQLFTDLSAAATAVENTPALRNAVEHWLGSPVNTEILLRMANVVSDSFSQGRGGSLVDLVYRLQCWQANTEQEKCWQLLQHESLQQIAQSYVPGQVDQARPSPLPGGAIQKYDETAEHWSLASFSLGMAFTHDLTQSASTLFSSVPKPAHLGFGSFRMALICLLGKSGILVLNPERLERLDRVDHVLIDEDVLTAEHEMILSRYPTPDHSIPLSLLDRLAAERTFTVENRRYRWSQPSTEQGLPTRIRKWWQQTGQPLASLRLIERDGSVVSAVVIESVRDNTIESLLSHIQQSNLKASVISGDQQAVIREHQSRGETILALGRAELIGGADIAVGIQKEGQDWPTGCHLLARDPIDALWRLTSAAALARTASAQSVELAKIDAFSGLILSLGTMERRVLGRIRFANNLVTLGAIVNGYRLARKVAGIPEDLIHDFTPWHAMDVPLVLDRLRLLADTSETVDGIPKSRTESTQKSFGKLWLEEMTSPLMPALATGTGLAALTGAVGDALLITAVIALNGLVGGGQRYQTARELARLTRTIEIPYSVMRGDYRLTLRASELRPGDQIKLAAGDLVPADSRILEATSLEVDESSLTGESLPVKKQSGPSFSTILAERSSMLFEGTAIAQGTVLAAVVAPQHLSEARRATYLRRTPDSGVEARLNHLTELTIPMAAFSGIALLLSGLARNRPVREVVGSGISLAVAAVPEGLPIMATLAQLSSAKRLSEKGALARNPRAIEALGRMDVLCADKTGTLTEGRLALRSIAFDGEIIAVDALDDAALDVLATGLLASPDGTMENDAVHFTDRALGDAAKQYNGQLAERLAQWQRVKDMPFKSERNYHAALFRSGNQKRLCVKGAPESILSRCNRSRSGNNRPQPLTDANRARLTNEANALARRGFRVLAVADRPARSLTLNRDKVARLIFRGFLVLSDPVRPTAKDSVAQLREAGIRVTMITGDHPLTAGAIAEELHIDGNNAVLTGEEIERLNDPELMETVKVTNVFARVSPAQKARLVKAFQAAGHVVGMTGDGANDAAALRLAEVGIALGANASVAAQQAADLQVVDGRIETIGTAVLEGRALWTAVRDAVSLLVGGNLGEIGFSLIAGLFLGQSPLNARQLLLINLLTDTVPALAVALRKPTNVKAAQLLSEGPEASLGDSLTREIQWRAGLTTGITTATWGVARLILAPDRASTVAMLTLISSQLAQTLVSGKGEAKVTASALGSFAALAAMVEIPGLNRFFGCRPPGLVGWTLVTGSLGISVGSSLLLPRLDRGTSQWTAQARAILQNLLTEEPAKNLPRLTEQTAH